MELRIRKVDQGDKGPFDRLRDRGSFGTVSELAELAVKFREEQKYLSTSLGAKFKGSNGGVAVELPHRNSSVFNKPHIN